MSKRLCILFALTIVLAMVVTSCQATPQPMPTQPVPVAKPTQPPAKEGPTQAPVNEALKPYLDAKINWKQFAGKRSWWA